MKKLLLLLALSGCVAAGHAQEILLGTDFKMYFDNKEFGSNEFAVPGLDIESGTDFAANLSPTRANGLAAMVKQMRLYALAFQAKSNS